MISRTYLSKMAFLSLLCMSLISCRNEDRDLQEMEAALDSISQELETEKQRNDSPEGIIGSGSDKDIPVYFNKDFDTIENPHEYIATALKEQREKIPVEAVLGGKMEFRQVEVLTENWVMAVYDDGHIQGKSIFKYELQPNGKVKFIELVSQLPNER